MDRTAWLRQGITENHLGLEIGPLNHPIVGKPGAQIRYADHLGREALIQKYAAHSGVDPAGIPEIDYIIGPDGLLAAVGDDRFRYLIASHVIEHVPNPIKWLTDIHTLLEDGGWLALAIPDRGRCFDALRRETTAGEWVEAALLEHSRPSPGRIFDALANEVKLDDQISWNHQPALEELKLSRKPDHALSIARHVLASGEYFDVHCWAFTPESFCNLMRTVVAAGMLELHLLELRGTAENEFLVRLSRADHMDRTSRMASYPAAGERYRSLPEGFDANLYYHLNPDVRAAGVDPNDHYVEYGRREQRRWR
ncbi:methyltransferase domain-containing protein [Xanthomonas translucens]|uniref:methyltransferase domain-containing protein n=1 Tax=Xanthomonas campestris pv. translucens TaxID=343 RepID=UPI000B0DCDAD|nr:methyltransferase domain-containing protein [Xanthomonas translucens]UPU50027.1 class I SAM-dependent methyltransferase [Xanthomonas translucens pv. undulosa]